MANSSHPKLSAKELSANNYIAVVVVITLVIVVACGFAASILVPKLVLNTKVIQKKLAAKQEVEKKYDNAQALVQQYESLGPRADLVLHAVPDTADFAQILTIMENVGAASSVRVKSVAPPQTAADVTAGPASQDSYQKTKFTVTLEGSYDRIISAIKNLEQSARPLKVVNTQLQGSGTSMQATLDIETYFQPAADINDKTEVVK